MAQSVYYTDIDGLPRAARKEVYGVCTFAAY